MRFVFVIASVALLFLQWGCGDLCGNSVVETKLSPDGRLKAIVFNRDCGATTGLSTQVSILAAGSELRNEKGNTFIGETLHTPGEKVTAIWDGPRRVIIIFPQTARTFLKQNTQAGVAVAYEVIPGSEDR